MTAPPAPARPRARASPQSLADHAPLAALVAVAGTLGAVVLHLGPAQQRADAALVDAAVAAACVAGLGLLGIPATARRRRQARADMEGVDAMDGAAFEERLALLLVALGYRVEPTAGPGDFGADLVAERDGVRTVVQAKRYRGAVGIEAVQQVAGARRYYEADAATVVTNSRYTPSAVALAGAAGVRLVAREELMSLLAAHPVATAGGGAATLASQVRDGVVVVGVTAWAALRLVVRTGARLGGALAAGHRRR